MKFDQDQFIQDLDTFVRFKTIVCENKTDFQAARRWIRAFFDSELTDFIEIPCHGLVTTIIKPANSARPRMLGDGHIEVVPGIDALFEMKKEGHFLRGRGVADMKTQCLMMMYVLRNRIAQNEHNDFWLVFSEDEEVGSAYGVKQTVDYLAHRNLLPHHVFSPDGGPDFAYVEKEKGLLSLKATAKGKAAHGSRPFLGINAIDKMMQFNTALNNAFPNPTRETDWRMSTSMTEIFGGSAVNTIPDHCDASFDVRITEMEPVEETASAISALALQCEVDIEFLYSDTAAYYPQESPIAKQYINILREISGKEPEILYSNGASNGRFYYEKDIHVLMSNPTVSGPHTNEEALDARSLPAYYELVQRTASL